MKANGIDVRKFNAKQLTVDLQPPKVAVDKEWIEGAAVPTEFPTEVQCGTLKVQILFRGSSRNDTIRKISEFLSMFTQKCQLNLDGYRGTYIGFQTSSSIEKTKEKGKYILTMNFDGYMTDNEIVNTYKGRQEAVFETVGTRDTPCIVEVIPLVDMVEYTITGFGDYDIIIQNLKQGIPVIIDGTKGKVTEEGRNKFAECDMWEFPTLKKDKVNRIIFSSRNCDVRIRYSPMYL